MALGGNALLRRGEPLDVEHQHANVRRAARAIARIARDDDVVVTHGNGPQVGLLALQAAAYREVSPYPLDVLGAESEGMIGYLLEQHLLAELPGREVATLLTQVVVDPRDPAFAHPTTPIGPVYPPEEGRRLAREQGWALVHDGDGVRRVVPSPAPRWIIELRTIERLLDAGTLVVCAGGGGIPVVLGPDGAFRGVEAVVDKDATAALLAVAVDADVLLILTDVPAVRTDWPSPDGHDIRHATPAQLGAMSFPAGSMGPKIEAACRFVTRTHRRAAIGRLEDASPLLANLTGTQITIAGALVTTRPSEPATTPR
ncbi:MAG TPA: carbamate kinase [Acidimicrobiales bacterium]